MNMTTHFCNMDNEDAQVLTSEPTTITWQCPKPCGRACTLKCGVMIGTYMRAFNGALDWTLRVGDAQASGQWTQIADNAQVLAECQTDRCDGKITMTLALPRGQAALWTGTSVEGEREAKTDAGTTPCFAVYCPGNSDVLGVAIVLHSRYQCGGTLVPVMYANELASRGVRVTLSWLTDEGDLDWLDVHPDVETAPFHAVKGVAFDALIASLFYTADALRSNPTERKFLLIQGDDLKMFPEDRELIEGLYSDAAWQPLVVARWLQRRLAEYDRNAVYLPTGMRLPSGLKWVQAKQPTRPRVLVEGNATTPGKGVAEAWEAIAPLDCEKWLLTNTPSDEVPASFKFDRVVSQVRWINALQTIGRATVLLKPSHHEGSPLPHMEAMAVCTPLVTTDCQGTEEHCIDGHNCLMVPVGDVAAMRAAVSRLIGDKQLRARLAANGNATAFDDCGWEHAIDTLLSACSHMPPVAVAPRDGAAPRISVLICTYDSAHYLPRAVDSILAQTVQDFEIVIIDDGSTDETEQVVRNIGDERIHYYKLPENVGLTKALNIGVQHCTGEYIARQDADDASRPTRLAMQAALLDANPDMGVAGAWFEVVDVSNGTTITKRVVPMQPKHGDPRRFGGLALGGSMVRADALRSIGGHDPNFRTAQDFKFFNDIARAGWRVGAVQEVLYQWRFGHDDHVTHRPRQKADYQRALRSTTLPEVGILIVAFNRLETTMRAVDAVRAHTTAQYSLYLLDNGSTDGTHEYFDKIKLVDPVRTQVFHSDTNLGCAGGRSAMMPRIDNELVMWLDNDMIVAPGYMEPLVDAMGDKDVAAATMLWKHGDVWHGPGQAVDRSGDHVEYMLKSRVVPPPAGATPIESAYCPGGATLWRRNAFWMIHDWDAGRVPTIEDLYMSLALRAAGRRLVCVPDSRAAHVPHDTPDRAAYRSAIHGRDGVSLRAAVDIIKADHGVNPVISKGWAQQCGARVLLVFPPPPDLGEIPVSLPPPLFPQGLGFVGANIAVAGHEVMIVDYRVENPALDAVLGEFNPDWVGVYTTTIGWVATARFLEKLRTLTASPIVVGGPHATLFPETIPHCVDHIVRGEGEHAMLALIRGRPIPRVCQAGRVSLESIAWPDFRPMVDKPYCREEKKFGLTNMASLNDTRGCPHACKFCSARRILKGGWTAFPAERVVEAAEQLKELGFESIYFRADNWTHDPSRVQFIAEGLVGLGMRFACETRVDALTDHELRYLADRGLAGVYLGVESGSQRVLDSMAKGIRVEQTKRFIRLCKDVGVKTYASTIWYYPGETDEDRQATQDMLDETQPDDVGRNVFIGMPGSRITEQLKASGEYEHIDASGIVYPIGYAEHAKAVYGRSRVSYKAQETPHD